MSTNNIDKIKSALRRLDLSDNEQTVYLSLLTAGATTARVLSSRTGITRPSVYDQLKSLREINLIVELEVESKTHFAATDIKHLNALLEDKIDRLEQSRDFLNEALPSLRESLEIVTPKLRFFEGVEGVKQLLKDLMWHSDTTIQIYWPAEQMNELFDIKFLEWFDDRRTTRKLIVESLWPEHTNKQELGLFKKLPGDIQKKLHRCPTPNMAFLIYDKKVAFISSNSEAFGFITESKEFSELQKIQFNVLWNTAK